MAIAPTKIHLGMARVFVGVTAPVSGAPPTYIVHTAGVPGSGTDCGATQDDTTFNYKATKYEIECEQTLAPVDVATIKEEGSITFTCKEHTYFALKQAFDNIGTETVAGGDAFWFGGGTGILNPNTACVFVSSMQRNAPTKFIVACLYKAYTSEGFSIGFSKSKESIYKVTLTGIMDMTRATDGDRMGYYRIEK